MSNILSDCGSRETILTPTKISPLTFSYNFPGILRRYKTETLIFILTRMLNYETSLLPCRSETSVKYLQTNVIRSSSLINAITKTGSETNLSFIYTELTKKRRKKGEKERRENQVPISGPSISSPLIIFPRDAKESSPVNAISIFISPGS